MTRPLALLAAAAFAAASAFGRIPEGSAAEKSGKPDVTSRGGLRIGSALIPWGAAAPVELNVLDGAPAGPRACVFNATYEMSNLGGGATGAPFTNRLRVDGAVVAATTGLALNARETKSVTTSPSLPAGAHSIELSLDDESSVSESREDNNRFKVQYVLKATCGATGGAPKK
ncbi:MAG: CARDB domain-containing protein [Acidobacteriota bacterium]